MHSSFPSGEAGIAGMLGTYLYLVLDLNIFFVLFYVVGTCYGRVYCRHHHVLDVLIGVGFLFPFCFSPSLSLFFFLTKIFLVFGYLTCTWLIIDSDFSLLFASPYFFLLQFVIFLVGIVLIKKYGMIKK